MSNVAFWPVHLAFALWLSIHVGRWVNTKLQPRKEADT